MLMYCGTFADGECSADQLMLGLLSVARGEALSLLDDTLLKLVIVMYADWNEGELIDADFRRRVRALVEDAW